jgi:hypothetical protein
MTVIYTPNYCIKFKSLHNIKISSRDPYYLVPPYELHYFTKFEKAQDPQQTK